MQFKAFEAGIEVYGVSINAIVEAFKLFPSIALKRLAAHGIGTTRRNGEVDIDTEGWYAQQAWLDAFKDIANSVGAQALFQIGRHVPKHAVFPPTVTDIHSGIKSINVAYHMNHRKFGLAMFEPSTGTMLDGIGQYGYADSGRNTIKSVCENPYPCEFDHGILTAIAQRFEKRARVDHDPEAGCRAKTSGRSCTYHIAW
jgi:hypothetical protein